MNTINYSQCDLINEEIAIFYEYPDNAFSCIQADCAVELLLETVTKIENSFVSADELDKEKYISAVRFLHTQILQNLQNTKIYCPSCDEFLKGKEESNLICLSCDFYLEKNKDEWGLYQSKISTDENWNNIWVSTRSAVQAATAASRVVERHRALGRALDCATKPAAARRGAAAARAISTINVPIIKALTLNACLKFYKMKAFV